MRYDSVLHADINGIQIVSITSSICVTPCQSMCLLLISHHYNISDLEMRKEFQSGSCDTQKHLDLLEMRVYHSLAAVPTITALH